MQNAVIRVSSKKRTLPINLVSFPIASKPPLILSFNLNLNSEISAIYFHIFLVLHFSVLVHSTTSSY